MATLTISDGIAAGSFVLSILALWRSGQARVLDLRTAVRKDVAALCRTLEDLRHRIKADVQSRHRVSAALGGTGAAQAFAAAAEDDMRELTTLRARLDDIEPMSFFIGYGSMEKKAVVTREVQTRIEQLSRKYVEALAEDDRGRQHIRDTIVAKVGRSPP